MLSSMTCYAEDEITIAEGTLHLSIRSVNHRYLDLHIKLPELLRPCETNIRSLIRSHLKRGKVDVFVKFDMSEEILNKTTLNTSALSQLAAFHQEVNHFLPSQTHFTELLKWPNVLSAPSIQHDHLESPLLVLLAKTLEQAVSMRQREGKLLLADIRDKLNHITTCITTITDALPAIIDQEKIHIQQKLAQIDTQIDEKRFEQELVLWLQKIDISEEITRLKTHLVEIDKVLTHGSLIGRRLDFLMQEMNREANTLASKSTSTIVTFGAVNIKVYVEQIKEQVQNIE